MRQLSFRLVPGDLLKEEIESRTKGVGAGVLLSIVGSLSSAELRMAGATEHNQNILKIEGPLEIVSGTGTVSKDGCHIHIAVSDKEGRVMGGHLKSGCRIETTAEVVIGILEDVSFERKLDPQTGFNELHIS